MIRNLIKRIKDSVFLWVTLAGVSIAGMVLVLLGPGRSTREELGGSFLRLALGIAGFSVVAGISLGRVSRLMGTGWAQRVTFIASWTFYLIAIFGLMTTCGA